MVHMQFTVVLLLVRDASLKSYLEVSKCLWMHSVRKKVKKSGETVRTVHRHRNRGLKEGYCPPPPIFSEGAGKWLTPNIWNFFV